MDRGWYILCGLIVVLLAVLIGFAATVRHDAMRQDCAPGAVHCGAPPPP